MPDIAEERIRNRGREVAREVLPDIENIRADPRRLGQQLLADADVVGIDFGAGELRHALGIVPLKMQFAERGDADTCADVENTGAGDLQLEIIGQTHRREVPA